MPEVNDARMMMSNRTMTILNITAALMIYGYFDKGLVNAVYLLSKLNAHTCPVYYFRAV
jgi:hypothetical protein